jgi:MFS transporter, DHA1 family, tetracycline resistance protein
MDDISQEPGLQAESSTAPARSSRSALLIVFLVVFIDLLGFGIVLPLLPLYASDILTPLFPGDTQRVLRGGILGLLMASFSLMQFFFAPIWGRISDRIGRRPILLLGLFASVVFYTLFGVASQVGAHGWLWLSLALLFVSRLGAGVAGATISTAQAVIADTTTPERRARGMALIGAAFGIGFTFGPLLGFASLATDEATAIERSNFLVFAYVGLVLMLTQGLIYRRLVQRVGEVRFLSVGTAFMALGLLGGVVVLLVQDRAAQTALPAPPGGLVGGTGASAAPGGLPGGTEASASRLSGAPGYVAAGFSLIALLLGIALLPETLRPESAAVLRRRLLDWRGLQNALRSPTVGILIIVFFLATLAFGSLESTLALVNKTLLEGGESGTPQHLMPWALLVMTLAVMGFAFLTPSVQSLISRRSDPTKQGEILGVNQSASALARILGPLMGLSLFDVARSHILPYLAGTALLVIVFLLTLRIRSE